MRTDVIRASGRTKRIAPSSRRIVHEADCFKFFQRVDTDGPSWHEVEI